MKTHILGFPAIGKRRELKTALESFWSGDLSAEVLLQTCANIKKEHWQIQKNAGLSYVSTGDFSMYDRMLDTTIMLGVIPGRFEPCAADTPLERYFSLARGDVKRNIAALEMTKWFDTNYHYLVPEIYGNEEFRLACNPVLEDVLLAKKLGFSPKPAIIGPFTWLALAKAQGGADKWASLDAVISIYKELLASLDTECDYIQVDEPVLCTELLPKAVSGRLGAIYAGLSGSCPRAKLMLATYFGPVSQDIELTASSCSVLHIDLVRGKGQLAAVLSLIPDGMALSLGLVDGRNIWKADYSKVLPLVKQAESALGKDRVLLGSSCSLLHCPVDLSEEKELPEHIRCRLSFAAQKCSELADICKLASGGDASLLDENSSELRKGAAHPDICIDSVRKRVQSVTPSMLSRQSGCEERRKAQAWLTLPLLPTTTIGSFPQTPAIRKTRLLHKRGEMGREEYVAAIRGEIKSCIEKQEQLGLDVLVHGEAERNDMVEYFGQQLGGFCFTQNGWGAKLRKPLRETPRYLRRCVPQGADDGGVDTVRPVSQQKTGQGNAHRAGNNNVLELCA